MVIDLTKHLKREPQIYKNLELYPILILDTDIYNLFLETMCAPKDFNVEKDIIKMSYLKYLLFFLQGLYDINTGTGEYSYIYTNKLTVLLEYITRKPVSIKQIIDNFKDDNIIFHYEIYIGDETYYENDFDNIREIILEQNGKNLEYIESYNPELEKTLEFTMRNSPNRAPLQNRIYMYSTITHVDISDMTRWTVSEFEEKENMLRLYEEWRIYKPLEASGKIELKGKDKIPSPFEYEEKSKDRYASILMEVNDFNEQLKQFTN